MQETIGQKISNIYISARDWDEDESVEHDLVNHFDQKVWIMSRTYDRKLLQCMVTESCVVSICGYC